MRLDINRFLCVLWSILLIAIVRDAVSADVNIRVTQYSLGKVNRKIFGGAYYDLRGHQAEWSEMGMTTCREGGPGMESPGTVEPQPGVWKWEQYDHWLDWLKKNKTTGIVLLSGAADWMMKDGKKVPADWDYFYTKWAEYAAEMVRHTNIERRQGIRYWEIWNEPDAHFWFESDWGGDPPHYSALFNAAVKAMKAVDPTIMVGTGGIADPYGGSLKSWWEPCLRDYGVNKNIDFVCLHGYYGGIENGIWLKTIDMARNLMDTHIGHRIPIWVTEFNADYRDTFVALGLPFKAQTLHVAQTLGLFASKNIDAAQYFCVGWFGSDFCPWDQPQGGKARPVVGAYRFWNDYKGTALKVISSADPHNTAVAARHAGTTVLYLPVNTPGRYRIQFDGMKYPSVNAEAFFGDCVILQQVNTMENTVSINWNTTQKALLKVSVH